MFKFKKPTDFTASKHEIYDEGVITGLVMGGVIGIAVCVAAGTILFLAGIVHF